MIYCKAFRARHLIGGSLLVLTAATGGHAQSTPAAGANNATSSDNETIVVNARRREEPLQQAPVAVSYLSGKTLEVADVRRVTDLTSMVPNLSINSGYRQGSLWISLRGIPSVQGGEPPVTVLIDGVQVPGQDFINEELDDIASVQVLRGPQGAIYGRGAIGGAILIDTQRPTDEWHGSGDLLYGRHNDFRGSATIAGPLVSDKILARITVLGRRTDGLQPNFTTGKYADAGHAINVSGELIFNLDDGLTVDLNARHQQGVDGASYEYLVTDANRYDYNTVGTVTDPNVEDHHNINAVSAKIEKALDAVTLTSITQFARSASRVLGDTDFSAEHNSVQDNFITSRAWNEDLRVASNDHGQALNWLLGGFFQDRMVVNKLVVSGDPLGANPGVIFQNSDQHDKSLAWAIYGQASYKLPAGFELSVAARYDQDHRKSYDPLSALSEVTNTFASFQPAVTLKKQFNRNINAYATIGRGFRSGGFNPYADTVTLGVDRKYKSETSTNYEIGLKTTWLDKKLTVNLAAYHNVYDNQQLFFISINPVARDIYNIDKTHINGGEIEISYRPTKDLAINGNVGVSHSTIKKFSAALNVDGNRSPQSYSDTSSLSFTYTPKLTEELGAVVYGAWERRGKIYWDAQNQYKTDPASTFDARMGLTYKDFEASFFMKNISNKRFPVLFQANAAGQGVHGQLLNMPRTYGVELKAKF